MTYVLLDCWSPSSLDIILSLFLQPDDHEQQSSFAHAIIHFYILMLEGSEPPPVLPGCDPILFKTPDLTFTFKYNASSRGSYIFTTDRYIISDLFPE